MVIHGLPMVFHVDLSMGVYYNGLTTIKVYSTIMILIINMTWLIMVNDG